MVLTLVFKLQIYKFLKSAKEKAINSIFRLKDVIKTLFFNNKVLFYKSN